MGDLRDAVEEWRQNGWNGASNGVRHLLELWTRDPDKNAGRSLFFAQREALETMAYLTEIAGSGHWAVQRLQELAVEYGRGLMRIGIQMATGTGKTRVMAGLCLMYAALQKGGAAQRGGTLARQVDRIVIICPGRTIRGQLEGLNVHHRGSSLYEEMADAHAIRALRRVKVNVVNYEQLVPKRNAGWGGMDTGKLPKKVIGALVGEEELEGRETWAEVWRRVLGERPGQRKKERVVVLNDEGHHCWERKAGEDPGVWMEAIHGLGSVKDVEVRQVVDLSATPRFINRRHTHAPAGADIPEMFPWVVSEYGLMEAQESGLVKIPQRPTTVQGFDAEVLGNLYEGNNRRTLRRRNGRTDPDAMKLVDQACAAIYNDYELTFQQWEGHEEDPVLIAVVNTKANARAVYDLLAGDPSEPASTGKELLTNEVGGPMRSILVQSKSDRPEESEDARVDSGWLGLREVGVSGGAPEEELRETLRTVGQAGKPGGTVRCVVSVGMLTEGWDCRQVTHIIGYRKFGSKLLAEQTIGRALRRSDYERKIAVRTGQNGEVEHRYPAEYAAVLGVPIPSIRPGQNKRQRPDTPPKRTTVHPVPERAEKLKMLWPRIEGYRMTGDTPEVGLDPAKVREWREAPAYFAGRMVMEVRGDIGETKVIEAAAVPDAHVLWEVASDLWELIHLDRSEQKHHLRRSAQGFAQTLAAVQAWAKHPKVYDAAACCRSWDLRKKACAQLFDAITIGSRPGLRVGVGDGPDHTPTTGCAGQWHRFRTSLEHIVELERSELNVAACHSGLEAEAARTMDTMRGVASVARNHGPEALSVPYRREKGGWARYVPDFIVRGTRYNGVVPHLLVEMKGQRDDEARLKKRWTNEWWIPAANAWGEAHQQGWAYAMITADDDIASAVERGLQRARKNT